MATISDLRTQLRDWTGTNSTILPNATCDAFVNHAMAIMQRAHRWRGQEATSASLTYGAGVGSITLASVSVTDFIEERALYLYDAAQSTPSSQLKYMKRVRRDEWVEHNFNISATQDQQFPQTALPGAVPADTLLYALWDERIFILPSPSSALTLMLDYWAFLADLSDANTSNFFSTQYPDLLRLGGLAEAYEFLHEDLRAEGYRNKFQAALKTAVDHDQRLQSSGGSKVRGV